MAGSVQYLGFLFLPGTMQKDYNKGRSYSHAFLTAVSGGWRSKLQVISELQFSFACVSEFTKKN